MRSSKELIVYIVAIGIILWLGVTYVSMTEDLLDNAESNLNYILVYQVFPEKDLAIGVLRYPPEGVATQIHTLVGENSEDHEFIASLKPGDHIVCDSYGK